MGDTLPAIGVNGGNVWLCIASVSNNYGWNAKQRFFNANNDEVMDDRVNDGDLDHGTCRYTSYLRSVTQNTVIIIE